MPEKDEHNKSHSKVSMKIGDVQVEFEGTSENIAKLMNKEMIEFTKKLGDATKQSPPLTASTQKFATKTQEEAQKTQSVPPQNMFSTKTEASTKDSRFRINKNTEKIDKKKTNWKNMTTALIIACILLLASTISVIIYYFPIVNSLESQINEKQSNILALNSTISSLNSQISDLQNNLDQKDTEITHLQDSVEYLNAVVESYLDILSLNVSGYILSPMDFTENASETMTIFQERLDYAGYVGVSVQSSSNTTYVQLSYSYGVVNYDHNITVAESGTAYFPVLPAIIEIKVGNTDTYIGDYINGTLSAVYYY